MKTYHHQLSRIIFVLIFSMIMIHVTAQEKRSDPGNNKNLREQTPSAAQSSSQETYPAPPSPPSPPPPPPAGEGMDEAHASLDLPGLTPDQHDKIRKARLKQMADMTPLRNQLREKKARLSTILTTMPVDQKQADQVADEIGKIASAMLKLKIRHDQELRNILTPDQQVIFDSRPKPWLNRRP
jgi:Spy/CpxP family protein refolding chaperone